jgi:hypothetical protein
VTTALDEVAELIRSRQADIADREWTPTRIFAIFDVDKNGLLDRDEIEDAVTAMIEKIPTEEKLAALYAKYDANGDGQFDMQELESMVEDDLFKVRAHILTLPLFRTPTTPDPLSMFGRPRRPRSRCSLALLAGCPSLARRPR